MPKPSRSERPIRAIMVEPEQLARRGAEAQLNDEVGIEMISFVETGKEGLAAIRAHRPEVAVIAAHMPDLTALEVMKTLGERSRTKVLITAITPDEVYSAILAHARGYILRANLTDLPENIRRVAAGDYVFCTETQRHFIEAVQEHHQGKHAQRTKDKLGLTTRELEIMTMIANGLKMPAIAGVMDLSPHTVRTYARRAYDKLGVRTQAAAVKAMVNQGLID